MGLIDFVFNLICGNMDPLIMEIVDFKSLQTHVQSSEANLFDSTKDYYTKLGEKLGLETENDFEAEVSGVKMPKLALAWMDADKPMVAFAFGFSSKEDVLAGILSLLATQSDLGVLITSSKARNFSLQEIKTLLEEAIFLNQTHKFLLVDIAKEEFLVV